MTAPAWCYRETLAALPGLQGARSWASEGLEGGVFPVLADGCCDVIEQEVAPGVWRAQLSGPTTAGFLFPVSSGAKMRGLRLLPGQVKALFGLKPGDIPADGIDLGTGFSWGFQSLEYPNGLADQAVYALMAGQGPDGVAGRLGVAERTLRRWVWDLSGCSPKRLQRIWRLRRALLGAAESKRPDWSDIAVAHGYADQPHMIRDCRAVMGCTPVDVHHLMGQGDMAVSFKT